MAFEVAALLLPLGEADPCGPSLRHHDSFEALRKLAAAPERPDWGRVTHRVLALAREGHDLRVWVWLARASLCAEGLPGLASGLELIDRGLARYWDSLPPIDPDEADPRERHLARLMALAELGATNFRVTLKDLTDGGRNFVDLGADLDAMVARAPPNEATRQALERCHSAIEGIVATFNERLGRGHDPQLGFELILGRLQAIQSKLAGANGHGAAADAAGGALAAPPPPSALGPVASRDDVVRALNLVLEYYQRHEPSSPVPLLVQRAKKLVSMSFLDAIKELAPTGIKELQAVAGATDEKK